MATDELFRAKSHAWFVWGDDETGPPNDNHDALVEAILDGRPIVGAVAPRRVIAPKSKAQSAQLVGHAIAKVKEARELVRDAGDELSAMQLGATIAMLEKRYVPTLEDRARELVEWIRAESPPRWHVAAAIVARWERVKSTAGESIATATNEAIARVYLALPYKGRRSPGDVAFEGKLAPWTGDPYEAIRAGLRAVSNPPPEDSIANLGKAEAMQDKRKRDATKRARTKNR